MGWHEEDGHGRITGEARGELGWRHSRPVPSMVFRFSVSPCNRCIRDGIESRKAALVHGTKLLRLPPTKRESESKLERAWSDKMRVGLGWTKGPPCVVLAAALRAGLEIWLLCFLQKT